jgi:hypothetical protein
MGRSLIGKRFLTVLITLGIAGVASIGRARESAPRYDPTTETTVSGTVQHLEATGIARWGSGGTHLILNTGTAKLAVRLGPRRFLAQQGVRLADGDRIEVTGSKVRIGDEEAILARVVKARGWTLMLRDKRGKPQWSAAPRVPN